MLKWTIKKKNNEVTPTVLTSDTVLITVLDNLLSSDIKTHIPNQSISVWKDSVRRFVWQLSEISDIVKQSNRLVILNDDNNPITLIFKSENECQLASDKFTDAGNGLTV